MRSYIRGCPFCGEQVLFEQSANLQGHIVGECPRCTMKFEYEEKIEQNTVERMNGDVQVIYKLPSYRKLNKPFIEVWNNRVDD